MADEQLSTRDLAGTTPEAQRDASDQDTTAGTTPADEPLARDRAGSGAGEQTTAAGAQADDDGGREPLLPAEESERFTARWREIQTGFVDEPREAVSQADALVADLMQRLAASFSDERQRLEGQWDSGDDVSTEELRVALTRYRSFFDRLLSA